ncbi:MAG: helix-turn-helix transcriptional regulator [Ruminococcus sp.]|nr:helix-turn-helix transcriptional regulator [Ruminococcus sp.]
MTHAYSESYLSDAKDQLSQFLDYLINDCGMKPDWVASIFITSGYAEQFERGNPAILAGMSGIELARAVTKVTYKKKKMPAQKFAEGLSPEYWAGWALAEYQWYSCRRFKDIFEHVKLSEIISMYSVYHEMDISKFIETMNEKCAKVLTECRLKKLRESRGLSQAELARISGVSLRSIQMYEQRVNDIDKAQSQTVYKLSRVIGCSIEDLLEKPME